MAFFTIHQRIYLYVLILLISLLSPCLARLFSTRAIVICANTITTCNDTERFCCCNAANTTCGCCWNEFEYCNSSIGCVVNFTASSTPSLSSTPSVTPSQTQSIGATPSITPSSIPSQFFSISSSPTPSCQSQEFNFLSSKRQISIGTININNFSFLRTQTKYNLLGGFSLNLNNSFLYSPLSFSGSLSIGEISLFLKTIPFSPFISADNSVIFESNHIINVYISLSIYNFFQNNPLERIPFIHSEIEIVNNINILIYLDNQLINDVGIVQEEKNIFLQKII